LYIAGSLKNLNVSEETLSSNLEKLLNAQSPEGWFDEYGGPDFGYLSVAMDALADIHRINQDKRILAALNRAVDFVVQTIGVDNLIPFELGSRNTEYFYPYGLTYAARKNPRASWLLHKVFDDMLKPEHFLWSIDDRYMTHCTMASIVKSLSFLPELSAPEEPNFENSLWLPVSGLWFERGEDYTLGVSAHKGGIVRVARKNGEPVLDHGLRIKTRKGKWTNNLWNASLAVEKKEQQLSVNGACHKVSYDVPTPLLHLGLRTLAFFFRHRIKPLLKKIMILRQSGSESDAPRFTRIISHYTGSHIEIDDVVEDSGPIGVVPGPRQNLRYVPSANSFLDEEWIPPIGHGGVIEGEQKIERHIKADVH
jgi:hypothetical protein